MDIKLIGVQHVYLSYQKKSTSLFESITSDTSSLPKSPQSMWGFRSEFSGTLKVTATGLDSWKLFLVETVVRKIYKIKSPEQRSFFVKCYIGLSFKVVCQRNPTGVCLGWRGASLSSKETIHKYFTFILIILHLQSRGRRIKLFPNDLKLSSPSEKCYSRFINYSFFSIHCNLVLHTLKWTLKSVIITDQAVIIHTRSSQHCRL